MDGCAASSTKPRNLDFPLSDLSHDAAWVHAARQKHAHQAMKQGMSIDDAYKGSDDAQATNGLYTWSQTEEDVEVRVLKGLPAGGATTAALKRRIQVSYGNRCESLRVCVDGADVLYIEKLFMKVAADGCSWSVVDKGKALAVTLEKAEAGAWKSLCFPKTDAKGL